MPYMQAEGPPIIDSPRQFILYIGNYPP